MAGTAPAAEVQQSTRHSRVWCSGEKEKYKIISEHIRYQVVINRITHKKQQGDREDGGVCVCPVFNTRSAKASKRQIRTEA